MRKGLDLHIGGIPFGFMDIIINLDKNTASRTWTSHEDFSLSKHKHSKRRNVV